MDTRRLVSRSALVLLAAALFNAVFWDGGLDRTAWNVSLVLVGLAAAITQFFSGLSIPESPLGVLRWPLIGLPAYALLQTTFSVKPAATWEHALRLVVYALVFLVVRSEVRHSILRSRTLWLPVLPLLLAGGIEAAWSLTQGSTNRIFDVAHGTYTNRNHLAGLLEMVFPFAAMYAVACVVRARTRGFSIKGALRFCSLAALTLLLVIAELRTLSRMGLISMLGAALTMIFFMRPRRLTGWRAWTTCTALPLVAAAAIVWMLPPRLVERIGSLTSSDFSLNERMRLFRESLPILRDYPAFGCGLGGYEAVFARYKDPRLSVFDHAHNDYLQYLIELGPLVWGLALFGIGFVLVHTFRRAGRRRSGEKQFLAIAAASSLIAMLIHSLADYNLYIPANALVFAWAGGVAVGLRTKRSSALVPSQGETERGARIISH